MTSISDKKVGVVTTPPSDNGGDNFSPLQRVILLALVSQNSVASIVMAIDKDKSNVVRALKTLIKKGFVERMGQSYILSGKGHVVIQQWALSPIDSPLQVTTPSVITASSEDESVLRQVDHHDISFNVLLWHVPEGWGRWLNTCCGLHLPEDHPAYPRELKRAARKFGINKDMKGWQPVDITLFNGFSFRCHPKGVLVHVPMIVAETPSVAASIAFKRLASVLPRLERWLKLEPTALYKQGRLNIKLITNHYALFEKEFVSWWVNVEGKSREQFILRDEEGNLLWFMDKSHPFSIETSAPVVGELAANGVQDMLIDVKNGDAIRPKEAKTRVEAVEHGVGQVENLLERQAEFTEKKFLPALEGFTVQMEAHVGTAVAVHHGAESLNVGAASLDRAAIVLERSALAQEKASEIQAKTVSVLVEELRLERVGRRGGGLLSRLVGVVW